MFGEGAVLHGEQELAFKHVLIRDVAYGMLPKAIRARKHDEVGEFLEQRAGERGEEVVALLAQHYGRAAVLAEEVQLDPEELLRLRVKALACIEAAGDAAVALYANREALVQYEGAEAFTATISPRERGSPRSEATLRFGSAASTRRSSCGRCA